MSGASGRKGARMMIPRFRYWFTPYEKMTYVISIDFIKLEATIQPREIEYIVPIVEKSNAINWLV